MSRDLVVGIDSSTTSCKAIVWDLQGYALAEGRCSLALSTPRAGWHEQDADDWWQALCVALQFACSQVDVNRLAGLSITHQRETFVPVDECGEPLCPAMLWMDERAEPLLSEMGELFGRNTFHRITGKPLSANLTLPKIAWLQRFLPEVFATAVYYLDVHAFLVYRLTGVCYTGWGCADPTGMFDMSRNTWSDALLSPVGIHLEQLPQAFPPGEVLGNVTKQAAAATGLPFELPVVAGIGDGQAAGLGVNITAPGEAYLALGTSVVSGTFSQHYLVNNAFRTMYGGKDYLLETVLLAGGYTLSWFCQFMGGERGASQDELGQQAALVSPGSEGLVLVPYWNSVLGPYWDAAASGIVLGWRGIHGPAHLYRAILEGVAYEQRLNTQGVEVALERNVERYVAVGGGARSDLWLQIIADITGKPVYRSDTLEAAALGAGILATVGVGLYSDVRQAARAMTHLQTDPFLPDAGNHEFYTRLYEDVYRNLFPSLQPALKNLYQLVLGSENK